VILLIAQLLMALGLILVSCELFTNAIEWAGVRLKVGSGVVGSVLSGVGTALPETMVPIIAIVFSSNAESHAVGIGAIAGAPFMLGTLTLFVTGLAISIYALLGKRKRTVDADQNVLRRDLSTFLLVYLVAVLTGLIPWIWLHYVVGLSLIGAYGYYLYRTLNDIQETDADVDPLYFARFLRAPRAHSYLIAFQVVLALAGIIGGAKWFVSSLSTLAVFAQVSPLVLSMILTPIATELPEKMNSVIWTGRGKDTLALGNVTGAMVFQSCFPVGIGLLFTPWHLTGTTLVSALLVLASIGLLYLSLIWRKRLTANNLMLGGSFYALFVFYLLMA